MRYEKQPITAIKHLSKAVPPATGTIEAILDADLIIIGPGSIITSVMPAFLITEITEAIKKNLCV